MFLFKKKNILPKNKSYEVKVTIKDNFEDCVIDCDEELLEVLRLYSDKAFLNETKDLIVIIKAADKTDA